MSLPHLISGMSNQNNISEEILNEVKGLSPTLAEIPKTNDFTVPDGYFIKMQKEVQGKIQNNEKRSRILHLQSWKINLAAASLALLMVTWMVFGPTSETSPAYSLDGITADEIQLFIENDTYYEMDESLIIASLIEGEAELSTDEYYQDDAVIIDYLMESDIDDDLIINEYNNI